MVSVPSALTSMVPKDEVFTVSYSYDEINGFPAGEGQVEFGASETATVDGHQSVRQLR